MVTVAGVDGRRGGWALALAAFSGPGEPRLQAVEWAVMAGQDADGAAAVFERARAAGAVSVGVDAPIGLPDHAWRPCDLLAKRRLGRASARVFLAPPREVLAAPDYATARACARRVLDGKGVSAQAFGIRGIVLAVDDALRAEPGTPPSLRERAEWARRHVVEVHPELSFMAMSGRTQPLPPKRTPAGRAAREAALAAWLAPGLVLDAPDGDDHLDALAAAWSAERWARGAAEILGGELDGAGLPMQMVT